MKGVYLLVVLLLIHSRSSAVNVSAPGQVLPLATMETQLRTEYGTKPAATIGAGATVAPPTASAKTRPNDLLLGVALMSIPVIIVCGIHILLVCRRRKRSITKNPALFSPTASVALNPIGTGEYASPLPLRRPKSKSVTWQSPFETKGRRSHRITSTHGAMAASDLHFVMVATPDKLTPSHQQQQQKSRRSRGACRRQRNESSDEPIPQYRLDRLDSSPREYETPPPSSSSSLSLDASPVRPPQDAIRSPIAMLQDSGEYDSDSPRISMSSVNSDDPEILRKLEDAMMWTQMSPDFDASPESAHRSTRVMRSSSSLDDFRHDLHHENSEHDPEHISRSSEYSF